ncbi:hypothetical protein LCGC14_2923340, partial [marine sediment metagenome]
IPSVNSEDAKLLDSSAGTLRFDAVGLTGTTVLTEPQSRNSTISIFGATTGDLIVEVDADIEQNFWVRDATTNGDDISFRQTGGTLILLPKNRWVLVRTRESGNTDLIAGWAHKDTTPALSFAGTWRVVSGRPLEIRKSDANPATAGGFVHLTGAVEQASGGPPAAGNTMVTLPANYRPEYTVAFCVVAEAETAANADMIMIEINTAGAVIILNVGVWTAADLAAIDLTGISFFVAN